jgi:hypothetical protein
LLTGFYLALPLHTNNSSITQHKHELKTLQSSSRKTRKSAAHTQQEGKKIANFLVAIDSTHHQKHCLTT